MPTELFIKNMVCDRCIRAVRDILEDQHLDPQEIELGRARILGEWNPERKESLKKALVQEGFDLLEDQRHRLIERVKSLIIKLIRQTDLSDRRENLSDYLASHLHKDYSYISHQFSSVENVTIEQYFILQKIEMVKELLRYDELSLTEISYKLGYSSVAHLSAQFKKVTGFTPSGFRKLKGPSRKPLDKV